MAADNAPNSALAAPRLLLDDFHTALLDLAETAAQDDDAAAYRVRYRGLRPLIERAFALPTMSRLILGRHWDGLAPTAQSEFVTLLGDLTAAHYAARFKRPGHTFGFREQTPRGARFAVVSYDLRPAGKQETRVLEYQLMATSTGWQVINVAVDGVSDLSIKRSQYGEVIMREGWDALVHQLREKVATANVSLD